MYDIYIAAASSAPRKFGLAALDLAISDNYVLDLTTFDFFAVMQLLDLAIRQTLHTFYFARSS